MQDFWDFKGVSLELNPDKVISLLFTVTQGLLFGEEYRFLQIFSPGKHLLIISKKEIFSQKKNFPFQERKERSFIFVRNSWNMRKSVL